MSYDQNSIWSPYMALPKLMNNQSIHLTSPAGSMLSPYSNLISFLFFLSFELAKLILFVHKMTSYELLITQWNDGKHSCIKDFWNFHGKPQWNGTVQCFRIRWSKRSIYAFRRISIELTAFVSKPNSNLGQISATKWKPDLTYTDTNYRIPRNIENNQAKAQALYE